MFTKGHPGGVETGWLLAFWLPCLRVAAFPNPHLGPWVRVMGEGLGEGERKRREPLPPFNKQNP